MRTAPALALALALAGCSSAAASTNSPLQPAPSPAPVVSSTSAALASCADLLAVGQPAPALDAAGALWCLDVHGKPAGVGTTACPGGDRLGLVDLELAPALGWWRTGGVVVPVEGDLAQDGVWLTQMRECRGR
jgi:hypothetical protein